MIRESKQLTQMGNMFSNFNLKMLNLWIGLCRGEIGLPKDIRMLGYKDKWIELEFQNSRSDHVKPELIISSDRIGHTVLFEWKEGGNTDSDQLNRYADISSNDLVSKAMLAPTEVATHDICVIGLIENKKRLEVGITKGNHMFPLLAVQDDGISLEVNAFKEKRLSSVFSPKLMIDFSLIPMHIIPFDNNSELWEIGECIVPQIVEYMSRNEPAFTIDQIATDCVPTWARVMAPAYKKELKTKIIQVIDKAANDEFRSYIQRDVASASRVGMITWKIIYNPNSQTFDKRSREYKKLAKQQEKFITALKTGERRLQLAFEIDGL